MLNNNVTLENKTILVTGCAGFIGASLCKYLLSNLKHTRVLGIDSLNDYYDVSLKVARLKEIRKIETENWKFIKCDISNGECLKLLFEEYKPKIVVNLAAQAGVRYSITNPDAYIQSNIIGFYNILECCRHYPVEHLVYASSSSVYGNNKKIPYSTDDPVDTPVSLYAATKKSNELLAYSYSKLYGIPSTGLRFFTVYGPMGRPDMAYFSFTDKLKNGEKIKIFNYGSCKRDFTYIDDVIEGIFRVIKKAPSEYVPYKIYNIGNNHPENLVDFVRTLHSELIRYGILDSNHNIDEHMEFVPMQKGDVEVTFSDTTPLENDFGFKPNTNLKDGLSKFAKWYSEYYCS